MINTSAAYKEAIKKNRILHHEAKIEFSDGTALTPQDQDLYRFHLTLVLEAKNLLSPQAECFHSDLRL